MTERINARYTIDADLVAGVEAAAKASGRRPAQVVEQALRLALDPLPVLLEARQTLAAYKAEAEAYRKMVRETQAQINVLADYIVDAHRAKAANGNRG